MLIESLIFGTSRLTGGASIKASLALIDQCLAADVLRYDTAPSYGLGTAESVLGTALKDIPEAQICTKVGLSPPSFPLIRTYFRSLKSCLVPAARASGLPDNYAPANGPFKGRSVDFSTAAMTRSLERSQEQLRRQCIQCLLLHEAFAAEATPGVLLWMQNVRLGGGALEVGYSNGSTFLPAEDTIFPEHFLAQTALPLGWLSPAFLTSLRQHNFHSLAKSVVYMQSQDMGIAQRFDRAAALLAGSGQDRTTINIGVLFAVVHVVFPRAGLIFASIDPGRLGAFLGVVKFIDREVGSHCVAAAFNGGKVK